MGVHQHISQAASHLTYLSCTQHSHLLKGNVHETFHDWSVPVLRSWPWLFLIRGPLCSQCPGHPWEEGWPRDRRDKSGEEVGGAL